MLFAAVLEIRLRFAACERTPVRRLRKPIVMSSSPVRANGGAPAPRVYGWWATPLTFRRGKLFLHPIRESTSAVPFERRQKTLRRKERGAFLPAARLEPEPPTGAVSPM